MKPALFSPPATRQTAPRSGFILLPVLALTPAFLGGATELWSQGAVLLLLGLVMAVRPPRISPGKGIEAVSLALMVCAAAAFLPAAWFEIPEWRRVFVRDLGLKLGPCVTPQPLLTLEGLALLAAGLCWACYTAAESIGCGRRVAHAFKPPESHGSPVEETVRQQLAIFGAGVAVFAGLSLFFHFTGIPWPFPNAHYQFGPFPNRNQTGDLLAVGAVLLVARVAGDFRRGSKAWMGWAGATAIVLTALVLAYSRAAIVLFFGALIIWIACLAAVRRSGKRLAVGAGFVLVFWSAFLFGGGETLGRFLPGSSGTAQSALVGDLRWRIQKDALELGRNSPVTGIGLGNFESQFWLFHRALGNANYRVLHPESDWIWARVETGWLSVALFLAGGVLVGAQVFPLGRDAAWRMRAAAGSAALLVGAHGLVDVSGHRLGTVFPAIFVASLAILPGRGMLPIRPWLKTFFRMAGIGFFCVGLLWLDAGLFKVPVAGSYGVDLLKQRALRANREQEYVVARTCADTALKWAPLDWEIYQARATATALGGEDVRDALNDFRRARFLNPITPEIAFNEGAVWLLRRPALALPAWQEALRRAGDDRAAFFSSMLDAAAGDAAMLDGLRERAQGDPRLVLMLLEKAATPAEFRRTLDAILLRDPHLAAFAPDERRLFFARWAARPDRADFLARASREEWLPQSWPHVASARAAAGNFQLAYELARKFIAAPVLPKVASREPEEALQRALYLNPLDFAKGYALYELQIRLGHNEDALATLRKMTVRKESPPYLFLLEAGLHAQRQDWQAAWGSIVAGGWLEARAAPQASP